MREFNVRKTQFTVADFLNWQKEGTLDLNPPFQRRSVWKTEAKSYFIDTVVRGLPAPIIYLRQKIDLNTQQPHREVVDGQQRLRTLFSYINPQVLRNFNESRDAFVVKAIHNPDLADKSFSQLPDRYKQQILSYEFSTHVLPLDIEDTEVLEMFARLNATGVKLNHQELRNADYYGEFKSTVYHLALEQLDRWRRWRIFTDDQISRMKEVETTSDLVINMKDGLKSKTQGALNKAYEDSDKAFIGSDEIVKRFRSTMDQIENTLGDVINKSAYSSEVNFFTLFVFIYNLIYGLGSDLGRRKQKKLPATIRTCLIEASDEIKSQELPSEILDAVQRASTDIGRRRTRLNHLRQKCDVKVG